MAMVEDPRQASRRRSTAWPPHRVETEERVDLMSPRSATSTVLSRTLSETESQPQLRAPKGVDRACSPIRESACACQGADPHGVTEEFHYPPLGCLLGDPQASSSAVPLRMPAVQQDRQDESWQLQLEDLAGLEPRRSSLVSAEVKASDTGNG